MIVEDRSFVDAKTVEHLCCHLISGNVLIFLFHVEVTPHNVFCLEKIAVFHIFHFQIHRRKMISVHYQNHAFIKL